MTRYVAGVVCAITFLLTGEYASAQPEAGKYYRIINVNSKKALALGDGAKKEEETQVVQRAHGQNERQHWSFVAVGKHFRIINRKSGQPLNVHSKEEAPVFATNNGKNAQWTLEKSGEGYVIKSRHSGLVIDVAEESKDRKAPVIQYAENNGRNQVFKLELVE